MQLEMHIIQKVGDDVWVMGWWIMNEKMLMMKREKKKRKEKC